MNMISFSNLTTWRNCPRMWWSRYVEKETQPTTTAAAMGSSFGHHALLRMKTPDGKPVPINSDRPGGNEPPPVLSAEDELYLTKMLDTYFESEFAWNVADIGEKKILLTGERMLALADHFEVAYPQYQLKPLIGYIDAYRETPTPELIDIKTTSRKGFNSNWPLQNAIYSMATQASKAQIHCVVKNKTPKFYCYNIDLNERLFKWSLKTIFAISDQIHVAQVTGGRGVYCIPGFYCSWCPRSYKCGAYDVSNVEPLNS